MIDKALETMNLSTKEKQVYLTLLREGELTIQEISKKTNINRTFCYEVIKNLSNKGMISSTVKTRGKTYIATEPRNILLLMKEKEKIIEQAIPELEKTRNQFIVLPKIKLFEGQSGIKALMTELLRERKEIVGYSTEEFIKYLKYYLPNFAKERAKKRIHIKLILRLSKWTKEWLSQFENEKELREIKFEKLKKDFESTIYVFGDNTVIVTLSKKSPIGILIKDASNANTQRMIFSKIWKSH